MESLNNSSTSLFEVYLRLRPNRGPPIESFVHLEEQEDECHKHITIKPPLTDGRKRAVEKFSFTRVFEEQASQLDIFNGVSILPQLEGLLAPEGRSARDGLLATLGVTGSGKVREMAGLKDPPRLTEIRATLLWDQSINVGSHR